MVRELRSAVPTSGRSRSAIISDSLFVAGLVLTAVIMAWDRVPHFVSDPPFVALVDSRGLAPQEVLAFLLLLQRGVVMAWGRLRKQDGGAWPNLGLALAFGLVAVATGIAALTAFNFKVAVLASLIFCFALGRGWLLAQYVRERELKMFENVVLWVLAVMIVLGYFQFLGDIYGLSQSWTQLLPQYNSTTGAYPFPRVQSFALEPLYFGHWMFLPLGILLTRYWRTRKASAFEQVLLVLALGLFVLGLSRGAMLGLALALFAIFLVGRSWRPLLYVARSGVLAVLLVGGLLLLASAAHDSKTEVAPAPTAAAPDNPSSPSAPATTAPAAPAKPGVVGSFTGHALDVNDPSAQTRYDLWPQTLKIFLHHPFTGVGFNNARLLLHDGSATASPAEANALQPVNNDYLTFLSELGLVGVLLALPLLWLILRALWGVARSRLDHPSSPYAFAIIGMAFEANAFQSFSLLRTWVVVGLLLAGVRLMRERPTRADDSGDLAETVVLNTDAAETAVLNLGSVGSKTA